ncbi:MAG: nucleotidyltransferase domain-containing protein [Clostridia bacterium]|nr:nucleotidyltransferase domain-containing protein [Clostridia bacterium]
MSSLKEIRISKNLTQQQACALLGVSLRSYKSYENDLSKQTSLKYRFMVDSLAQHVALDEEHGILTLEQIENACRQVLDQYNVRYCILFGSYAKGTQTETSDVDLLISTDITGLRFFGIAERLRNQLHKKVDLLDLNQVSSNKQLLDEVLKDGVKIYEQSQK